MITLLRIILIRLLAGKKIQIAINLDGKIEARSNGRPLYVGPGIKTVLPGRATGGEARNLPPESPRKF